MVSALDRSPRARSGSASRRRCRAGRSARGRPPSSSAASPGVSFGSMLTATTSNSVPASNVSAFSAPRHAVEHLRAEHRALVVHEREQTGRLPKYSPSLTSLARLVDERQVERDLLVELLVDPDVARAGRASPSPDRPAPSAAAPARPRGAGTRPAWPPRPRAVLRVNVAASRLPPCRQRCRLVSAAAGLPRPASAPACVAPLRRVRSCRALRRAGAGACRLSRGMLRPPTTRRTRRRACPSRARSARRPAPAAPAAAAAASRRRSPASAVGLRAAREPLERCPARRCSRRGSGGSWPRAAAPAATAPADRSCAWRSSTLNRPHIATMHDQRQTADQHDARTSRIARTLMSLCSWTTSALCGSSP